LIVMMVTMVAIPIVPQIWLLMAVLFLSGITHGTLNVGGNVLLIWVHGSQVAPFMNALHFFFGVGTFVAPILVAQIVLLTGDMHWAYWLMALLTLPILLLTLNVRSPEPQHRPGQAGSAPVDWGLVIGFFLIFFGYAGAAQAYGGWIFTYVTRLGLANDTTAAYLNSLFWGALMAGRLLSIPLTVRFSPKAMLRADLVGAAISLGFITLFPRSLWVIAAGSAGLGFCLATIFPTNMSLASRHIAITGKVTGWFSIGSSLGALVLPWLVGQLFEPLGPELVIYLNLANILLTLAAYFFLVKRLERTPV
jgi:FHS family Na+ dependent glucose MFS transporter 1